MPGCKRMPPSFAQHCPAQRIDQLTNICRRGLGSHTESVFGQPLLLFVNFQLCPMDAVSGVNMLPHLRDVALAGQGGAALSPAGSFTNTSVSSSPTQGTDARGCENGALMDSFGIFLQGLLAVVAFSTLMCECYQRAVVFLFWFSLAVSRISDSCWVMGDCHRPIGSLG